MKVFQILSTFLKEPAVALTTLFLASGLFLFIVYPILSVLLKSLFWEDKLSAINYIQFFGKKFHYKALINSLVLAVITTLATLFCHLFLPLWSIED